jgi:opacity protein-like surface antigen
MHLYRASWHLAGAAALLAAAGSVQAVDYFRVDVGHSTSTGAGIRDRNFTLDGVICADAACTTAGSIDDVGNSAIFSGGLGWRFGTDWRVDATLAYRGGYNLNASIPDGTTVKGDVTSLSAMLAGYRDFSLSWGKPYVGAGIGYAKNEVSDLKFGSGGLTSDAPGGTKSGLAWAVMTGIGLPISPSLTLDLGYRYTDLGKLASGSGNVTLGGVAVGTYQGFEGRLKAHEISVGVRF